MNRKIYFISGHLDLVERNFCVAMMGYRFRPMNTPLQPEEERLIRYIQYHNPEFSVD